MLCGEEVEDDVSAEANVDGLLIMDDGAPGAVGGLEFGLVVVEAGVLDVDVLDVGAEVGESPGDMVVVADDDKGRPGRETPAAWKGAERAGASRSASYQKPGRGGGGAYRLRDRLSRGSVGSGDGPSLEPAVQDSRGTGGGGWCRLRVRAGRRRSDGDCRLLGG